MTTLYKLTGADGWTRRGGRGIRYWQEGAEHSATCVGEFTGTNFIHAFESPLLAVLLDPFPRVQGRRALWEAEGEVARNMDGLLGCRRLITHRPVPLPEVTSRQRAAFAVLSTLQVCPDRGFGAWAKNWLEGRDDASAHDMAQEAAFWAEDAQAEVEDQTTGDIAERSAAAVRFAARAARGRNFRKLNLLAIAEQAIQVA